MMSANVSPWMILPFGLLLGCVAVIPMISHRWWEKYYPKIALSLGGVVTFYYLFVLRQTHRPWESAHEYISFMAVMVALYVVSGGIHIELKNHLTPIQNTCFLLFGGLLSNLIGTTGASMLLIRPYLRANQERLKPFHVIFFIFIVSNVGGSLTPIADPPLYLGYIKGVPFFWTLQNLYLKWLMGMAWLLVLFFILDTRSQAWTKVVDSENRSGSWRVEGKLNFVWLAIFLGVLFIQGPLFLRETLMLFVAAGSWFTTKRKIHEANQFSWEPVKEVAILFIGIFATMMTALDWLEGHATELGIVQIRHFYWATGWLSAFLDNAPTYLNFLSAAVGLFVDDGVIQGVRHLVETHGIGGVSGEHAEGVRRTFEVLMRYHADSVQSGRLTVAEIQICHLLANHAIHLMAISISAVYFGAFTYIGNGPNFMVRSIAKDRGVLMPGFFGYIFKYSIPFLLPLLILVGWLFF